MELCNDKGKVGNREDELHEVIGQTRGKGGNFMNVRYGSPTPHTLDGIGARSN